MKSFGEDPQKIQPDEFFGMFDQFITSFNDARVENERFRKQKEDEERRAKMEAQVCISSARTRQCQRKQFNVRWKSFLWFIVHNEDQTRVARFRPERLIVSIAAIGFGTHQG